MHEGNRISAKENRKNKGSSYIKCLVQCLILCTLTQSLKADSLKWIRRSSFFIAGISEGYMDVLSFHYDKFQKVHPKANKQYWNPQISWQNKYNSKIPFAKTAMVWTTDGWHLGKFVRNVGIFAGMCIPLEKGHKWHWYLKEGLICYGINRIGFNIIYNGIYR